MSWGFRTKRSECEAIRRKVIGSALRKMKSGKITGLNMTASEFLKKEWEEQ